MHYSRDNIVGYPNEALAKAMEAELQSMRDFDVFEEVNINDVEPDCARQAIGSRWVHKWKGSDIKSRLVAKGLSL